MLKTTSAEFQAIELWFTDQTNGPLEIEDSVNITLITNNWQDFIKIRYSTEPKFRKYVNGYDFMLFARKFGDKYGK